MSKIEKVRKRDGTVVDFDLERITDAIFSTAVAVGGRDRKLAEKLSNEVLRSLEEKYAGKIPSVEDIQDMVERVLIERGHAKTAKAYILYRKQHEEMRKIKSTSLEVERVVEGYLGKSDWRVRENSNVDYSLSGLFLHLSGSIIANYALNKVYPMEIADAHINGDFHIHDLGMGITGYCAGWSLSQLLAEGFNATGKVASKPPAHLDTALLQIVNFIGSLANEWAGAQAFNSLDTLLAPFVREDKLSYRQVKQAMQTFVFNLNIASRWGGQTPFTNITLDLTAPEDLASQHTIIGGKLKESTYGEYSEEMDMINRALIEVMHEGDMRGRPFTFPIPTYSLTKDFNWDEGLSSVLFRMTAKYGLPYFQNFINSNLKPSDVRSMCCHLRLSLEELRRNVTSGLFGSGDSTGSVGVVTINMPRLGYLSRNEDEFFEKLEHVMELAKRALEHKRELVEKNIRDGLLPFTKRYLGTLRNHFSTIGLVGMNEALLNLFGHGIADAEGKRFAVKTLRFMIKLIQRFQRETGNIYNLEATPAEGVSYRLAKIDKQKYPDIHTAGVTVPYYTNSTCLPVNSGLDLIEALKHQEELQTLYTGGTVFHVFLGESLEDGESCMNLVRKIAFNTKLPYFTVTPIYSVCDDHGFVPGEHLRCPSCGRETEVYSRVVGYFRPVRNWNVGKQEEFRERPRYEVNPQVLEQIEIADGQKSKRGW